MKILHLQLVLSHDNPDEKSITRRVEITFKPKTGIEVVTDEKPVRLYPAEMQLLHDLQEVFKKYKDHII